MIVGQGRSNGQITPCDLCPLRKRSNLREFDADELAFVKEFKVDELRVDPGTSFLSEGERNEHLYTVLWDLYSRFPTLAFDITWLAAREEQLIDEHLVSLGRRTALERTAYLLLHLFVRAEEADLVKNNTIQFPFTQQHLADTLGMSLVHTNKTLKRLLASQAVRWKDRVFEIVDRNALVEIAGDTVTKRRPRPFI
jgi:hypothetical protein